jgi:hypothetical protein
VGGQSGCFTEFKKGLPIAQSNFARYQPTARPMADSSHLAVCEASVTELEVMGGIIERGLALDGLPKPQVRLERGFLVGNSLVVRQPCYTICPDGAAIKGILCGTCVV